MVKTMDRMPIILSALLTLIVASCDRRPNEVAPTGANPPVSAPVGPIPGAPETGLKPRTNPYTQDPIALTEGRRLFVWYNCYGCHAVMPAGEWGRVCAM